MTKFTFSRFYTVWQFTIKGVNYKKYSISYYYLESSPLGLDDDWNIFSNSDFIQTGLINLKAQTNDDLCLHGHGASSSSGMTLSKFQPIRAKIWWKLTNHRPGNWFCVHPFNPQQWMIAWQQKFQYLWLQSTCQINMTNSTFRKAIGYVSIFRTIVGLFFGTGASVARLHMYYQNPFVWWVRVSHSKILKLTYNVT